MELQLVELKAPIEVHFVDGFPIPQRYKQKKCLSNFLIGEER
jgi:hypothetical protein